MDEETLIKTRAVTPKSHNYYALNTFYKLFFCHIMRREHTHTDPRLRSGVFFYAFLGEHLGEVLSMTGGQIGDKSGTNPYFTDILFMGEHTQMGSTPVISTNDNPMK